MNIAISVAETSGDVIAAPVVAALKAQSIDTQIQGMVGDKAQAQGAHKLWSLDRVNVMGFTEVLKKLPDILTLRRQMFDHFAKQRPDVFVGVDAPDFNLKLEHQLKAEGIKTVHLVSPSVWAWRQKRVEKIKQSCDLVLCLFPFEVAFYEQHGQAARFIGHPLAAQLQPRGEHQPSGKIVLMPGSRGAEIKQLLPEMLGATQCISKQQPKMTYQLVLANQHQLEEVQPMLTESNIQVSVGDAHAQIRQADLVLVASGTAALEVALIGVPMVVIYRLSSLSYQIASRLLKTPYVSLPNILAGKALVPELIQDQARDDKIAEQALALLAQDHTQLTQEFAQIHQSLCLDSAEQAAQAILEVASG